MRGSCPRSRWFWAAPARARAAMPSGSSSGRRSPAPISRPPKPGDAEMAARIAEHRARRGPSGVPSRRRSTWPRARRGAGPAGVGGLPDPVAVEPDAGRQAVDREFAALSRRCARRPARCLVANEVGLGLVPETPLGRRFRDAAGRLNQEIAALADRVVFVAAGLPLVLKDGQSCRSGSGCRASGGGSHPPIPRPSPRRGEGVGA